jgi:xylan 1,4-beta-xylosidase
VGGPDVAGSGGKFTRDFLEHCLRGTNYANGRIGTPLDFISFHAKGAPITTNGRVRMGIATHLRTIENGFNIIASFPELKGKPVIIGESDPEGCAACQGPALAYRNGTMYSSYTVASFARKWELADKHHVNLEGALTWAFEFEDQPYFAGFRSLASHGIDKPVLNAFRMLSRLDGQRVACASDSAVPLDEIVQRGVRGRPDVGALATRSASKFCLLVWHYHDDDVEGPDAAVEIGIKGISLDRSKSHHFRIDERHSNAFTAWLKIGSPQSPTPEQYAQLESAGRLATIPSPVVENGAEAARLKLLLPRKAVSLLEWDL